jgi:protein-disulfide isomerase
MDKYPNDIKYIFKHFPLPSQKNSMEISSMVSAVQDINEKAFWAVHDFMFSEEGQALVKKDLETMRQKIEQIVKDMGFDVQPFRIALETGKGKKRVEGDMALGNKMRVSGTPTTIINGFFHVGVLTDKAIEEFLKK